ncbi:MFS domain-containing protein [Nephila pilipes]|uniref:MFS domain-containing protein n=1 Tax=Nephila pilipes TaxID=299642 RepID=A0A8X6TYP7_NEPPI|nr:MFS domain-containing protein [Nephila pilipes]
MARRRSDEGPDTGWSWVVAFAAFFNSLVLSGILRSSGVLFVVFIDIFGVTRQEASWPLTICFSVLNFIAPVSVLLENGLGVRPIVMIGAVVGAIGLSTCFIASSLNIITILLGVFGIGYGLVSAVMPITINNYFLDRIITANSIASSGACIGSIIFPVMFEYLIDFYELSSCLLLTGGIVLNVAIAGALMRPPSWLKQEVQEEIIPLKEESSEIPKPPPLPLTISERRKSISLNFIDTKCDDKLNYDGDLDPKSNLQRELQSELALTLRKRSALLSDEPRTLRKFQEESFDSLDTSLSSFCARRDGTLFKESDELLRAQKEFEDSLSDFQSVVVDIVVTSKSDELLNRLDPDEVKTSQLTESCPARHSFSISSAKRKLNKFKSPIPSAGPLKKHKYTDSSGEINCFDLYPVDESGNKEARKASESHSLPTSKIDEEPNQTFAEDYPSSQNEEESHGYAGSFVSVITSFIFYLTAFTNISFYFLFHMFISIIVDYSMDRGIPNRDTKYVLMVFAFCDFLGRVCLGWVTEMKYFTRSRFVMLCMGSIGLIFFTLPFATDYWSLLMVSGCYGLLLGCMMIVFPILLMDFFGMELYAITYGFLCFLNGFASLPMPSLIGYFRDVLGSYDNLFFILGVISIVASATWMFERCLLPKNTQLQEEDRNANAENSS